MSTLAKVFAILIGLAILLPGLCFVAFGVLFAWARLTRQDDPYGLTEMAPWQLLMGAGLTIAAILIFRQIGRRPPGPPPR